MWITTILLASVEYVVTLLIQTRDKSHIKEETYRLVVARLHQDAGVILLGVRPETIINKHSG